MASVMLSPRKRIRHRARPLTPASRASLRAGRRQRASVSRRVSAKYNAVGTRARLPGLPQIPARLPPQSCNRSFSPDECVMKMRPVIHAALRQCCMGPATRRCCNGLSGHGETAKSSLQPSVTALRKANPFSPYEAAQLWTDANSSFGGEVERRSCENARPATWTGKASGRRRVRDIRGARFAFCVAGFARPAQPLRGRRRRHVQRCEVVNGCDDGLVPHYPPAAAAVSKYFIAPPPPCLGPR